MHFWIISSMAAFCFFCFVFLDISVQGLLCPPTLVPLMCWISSSVPRRWSFHLILIYIQYMDEATESQVWQVVQVVSEGYVAVGKKTCF